MAQAVAETVANSLDAGAAHVSVRLHAASLSFTIEDDGHGIPAEAFDLVGGRHCTSKLRSLADVQRGVATLGFRGEAVHSIATVAEQLTVTSRARGSFETHEKAFKGGTVLRSGLAAQQLCRSGTTVAVRGLLFNQPVRRRHEAGQNARSVHCLCASLRRRTTFGAAAPPSL